MPDPKALHGPWTWGENRQAKLVPGPWLQIKYPNGLWIEADDRDGTRAAIEELDRLAKENAELRVQRDEAVEGRWSGTLKRITRANREGYEAGKLEEQARIVEMIRRIGCICWHLDDYPQPGMGPHDPRCPITIAARVQVQEESTRG